MYYNIVFLSWLSTAVAAPTYASAERPRLETAACHNTVECCQTRVCWGQAKLVLWLASIASRVSACRTWCEQGGYRPQLTDAACFQHAAGQYAACCHDETLRLVEVS